MFEDFLKITVLINSHSQLLQLQWWQHLPYLTNTSELTDSGHPLFLVISVYQTNTPPQHTCMVQIQWLLLGTVSLSVRSNSDNLEKSMLPNSNQQRIRTSCDTPYFWHVILECGLILMCIRMQQVVSPHTLAFNLIESLVHLCMNSNIPHGQPSPLEYPYKASTAPQELWFFAFKTGTTTNMREFGL